MARQAQDRVGRSLRSVIIEPFQQIKLGVYVIIVCLIFMALAGYIFHRSFNEQYQNVLKIFSVTDPDLQWQVLNNDIYKSNLKILVSLLLGFITTILIVVFRMTHKYYGPLVSIERFSDLISSGKYFERVQVRKGDELGRLAEKLNAMAAELERKHGSLVDSSGQTIRRRKKDEEQPKKDDGTPKA
jgi:signal transduction histidine kinase